MMADDGMKEVVDTISVATGVGALAGLFACCSGSFYDCVDRYTYLGNRHSKKLEGLERLACGLLSLDLLLDSLRTG